MSRTRCTTSEGIVALPPTMSLTAEKLDPNGSYLLDNGEVRVRVQGVGCRVWGVGCRVQGVGCRV